MNNKKVNFFYISEVHWGGAAAYVCHIVIAFKKMNYDVQLLKITHKGENKVRTFASGYEMPINYRNISIRDALSEIEDARYNHICVALYTKKNMDVVDTLLDAGCSVMIHGPVEAIKNDFPEAIRNFGHIPLVPRTAMASYVGGHFIPYPYNISIRKGSEVHFNDRPYTAISGARLSQLKSSGILFDVNERIIKSELDFQYKEHGIEERIDAIETIDDAIHLYGSFEKSRTNSLSKKYGYTNLPNGIPFFKGNYDLGKGPSIMSKYEYAIDLSNYQIKGEVVGSGDISNFAMFEAYDAGSVLIVHKAWLDNGFGLQDGVNCITVSNANELYDILDFKPYQHLIDYENYATQRKTYLERFHSPEFIVPKYITFWENM